MRELPSWFFGLPSSNYSPPSLVKPLSSNSHVIQFTMAAYQPRGVLARALSKLGGWLNHMSLLEGLVAAPSMIETETVVRYEIKKQKKLGKNVDM